MAIFIIHKVTCHETSDGFGADDLFINFRGERVFGPQEIDSGQTVNPGVHAHFFIRGDVEFWERDSGSDNDFLGGFTVHKNQITNGEMTAQLSGDDSNYTVTFQITAD
jgi:hypothetical protein